METLFNPYVLLIIAFSLIFLEFFLPGGILGIFGGLFLIFSFVAFYLEGHSPYELFAYFVVVLIALVFLIKWILKAIARTGSKNTIMLDDDQEGYVASGFDKELIHREGIAITDLKPSGKVLIDGKEVQVLSQLGYISKGKKIKVIGGQGAHLIVTEVK